MLRVANNSAGGSRGLAAVMESPKADERMAGEKQSMISGFGEVHNCGKCSCIWPADPWPPIQREFPIAMSRGKDAEVLKESGPLSLRCDSNGLGTCPEVLCQEHTTNAHSSVGKFLLISFELFDEFVFLKNWRTKHNLQIWGRAHTPNTPNKAWTANPSLVCLVCMRTPREFQVPIGPIGFEQAWVHLGPGQNCEIWREMGHGGLQEPRISTPRTDVGGPWVCVAVMGPHHKSACC